MIRTTLLQRVGVAGTIGVSGALVGLMIARLEPLFDSAGFVGCAAAGAFAAGLVLADGFGRRGPWGWALSAASFALATVLGAAIAVLFLPLEDLIARIDLPGLAINLANASILGPVYVMEMVTGRGGIFLPWAVSVLAVHLLALQWRKARSA